MQHPHQNMQEEQIFLHILSPAGGLLNAKGAQGRPLHTSPAKFPRITCSFFFYATGPVFIGQWRSEYRGIR